MEKKYLDVQQFNWIIIWMINALVGSTVIKTLLKQYFFSTKKAISSQF